MQFTLHLKVIKNEFFFALSPSRFLFRRRQKATNVVGGRNSITSRSRSLPSIKFMSFAFIVVFNLHPESF